MRRLPVLICAPVCALALGACARTVSTSSFHGEQRAAAQTVADLQSDATSADEKKICADVLAAATVARLGGTKGCEAAVKKQLGQIDSLELSVQSVALAPDGKSATASVKSVHEGKRRVSSVSLVREGSAWKISSVS